MDDRLRARIVERGVADLFAEEVGVEMLEQSEGALAAGLVLERREDHARRRARALAHQRRRWAQILSEALWIHRPILFNPRYGMVGLLILPYYLIFELGSAPVELGGILALVIGLPLGIVSPAVALLFIVVGLGYATLLTLVGVIIEEFSYNRYRTWRDFGLLAYAAIAENIGYRQIYAWWRVRGIVDALLGRRAQWVAPDAKASPPGVKGMQPV